ncbi:unnamed protein product [Onchocerca flexuosa]|uniref:Nitroreductase domain-containing protein n=1 Tax=Onchocerca flexuosa TaxID=387005 RepID=A0A183I671_9BILA|nr:unnamed protein product [Onchocerca flexuosa]
MSTETKRNQNSDDEILKQIFVNRQMGEKITRYLSDGELKHMSKLIVYSDEYPFISFYRTIKVMSDAANFKLNRRSRILHLRDGKMTPPFQAKAWERISQINFKGFEHRKKFMEHHWSPAQAILFGGEKLFRACSTRFCFVLLEIKLIIAISSDDQLTQEKAENRAFVTAQILRMNLYSAPICIVAQSDIRENAARFLGQSKESSVLMLTGHDVITSTLVIDTEDEETLKEKFLNWKFN